jgi:hypothetical protein
MLAAMHIRPARTTDAPSIWRIIGPVIRAGETYALDPDMAEADALAYWLGTIGKPSSPKKTARSSALITSAPIRAAAASTFATVVT